MKVSHRRLPLALALVMAAGSALRAGSAVAQEDATRTELSAEEMESLYWARQDSARMRFTQADVDFMTGMISHHAQAIVMSELAPSHGASQTVQTLAARIINSQRDEIARMQRWLELRDQPVPQVSEGGHMESDTHAQHGQPAQGAQPATHDTGGHSMHAMPGMLTPEQLDELRGAFGADFDRLFLTYMIQHHGGAIVMVDDLIAVDGAAQDRAAFKLASDIRVDQITEIERMDWLLEQVLQTETPD
jgi:uncharacterized protein (DUF305 family)